jgi:uncharacterized protein
MRCVDDENVDDFAATVLPWLEREPVLNNIVYTVIASRAAGGGLPTTAEDRWVRVLDRSELVGAATVTRPRSALLSMMPVAAAEALADHLGARGQRDHTDLPGVTGPRTLADAFADRYCALTGRGRALGLDMGCFRLDRVHRPATVPGRLRPATHNDRGLLLDWIRAFHAEAVPHQADHDPAPFLDARLREAGMLWLWEDAVGPGHSTVPVAYVGNAPPAGGVVRIGPVYTPPEHRGRGYASAGVAAVCELALDRGARALTLNTDLTNGTSNRIYQRIGFRRVGDAREWVFTPAPTATG